MLQRPGSRITTGHWIGWFGVPPQERRNEIFCTFSKNTTLQGGFFTNHKGTKQSNVQTLKNLKKLLMQHLPTGKVRVDVERINTLLKDIP